MSKKIKRFGIGKFLVMALVLGGGLIYGTQMAQKNQENRSSAASSTQVCKCSKPVYKTAYLCGKAKGTWICPKKPTSTPTPSKCSYGAKKCEGNNTMICSEKGLWKVKLTCIYGCKNGECISKSTPTPTPKPKCINGETICSPSDEVFICKNGTFTKYKECPLACKNGECISKNTPTPTPKCVDGETICSPGDEVFVCTGGTFKKYKECPLGCKNGECILSL